MFKATELFHFSPLLFYIDRNHLSFIRRIASKFYIYFFLRILIVCSTALAQMN